MALHRLVFSLYLFGTFKFRNICGGQDVEKSLLYFIILSSRRYGTNISGSVVYHNTSGHSSKIRLLILVLLIEEMTKTLETWYFIWQPLDTFIESRK